MQVEDEEEQVIDNDGPTYRTIPAHESHKICKVNECWNTASWVWLYDKNHQICDEHAKNEYKVPVIKEDEESSCK